MVPKFIYLFPISPLLVGYGTRNYYEMACKIQIKAIATSLMIFDTQMNIFFIIKVKKFIFIKWSHRSSESCRLWPRMTLISWARSPVSFRHISCWCLFIDPHLTTYHCCLGIRHVCLKLNSVAHSGYHNKADNLCSSSWSSVRQQGWPVTYLVIENGKSLHDRCLPLANWAAVILFGWKELPDLLELSYQLKQSYDVAQENHNTNDEFPTV
jgi:hypothetical protein